VDWGDLGAVEMNGEERKVWGFAFTLGYSRTMMAEAALDQKLGTLLRMHEEAFRQLGGVPEEILYDRMKTVWLETDERGESLEPGVSGLRALLGFHAAALQTVSGPDQRQSGIRCEVYPPELPVRITRARAEWLHPGGLPGAQPARSQSPHNCDAV
jgi:hypothetical protein